MSTRVDSALIEKLVGVERHDTEHIARGVTAEGRLYVLHPKQCLADHDDLRECPVSQAMDRGVLMVPWRGWEDRPVIIEIGADGRVRPVREAAFVTMHPDVEAVHSPVWDVMSPTERRGYVTVTLVSKRMHEDVDADAQRADEIARALVTDAVLTHTSRTLFNKQAVRWYKGTGLTDLARRRG